MLAIVGAAVFGHLLLAPSPLAKQSWQWADYGHRVDVDAAVAMVPKGVAVAASEHIVPHLTGRAQVWDLPNPYLALFYGPSGVDQAKFVDANAPEWLLVETASTGGETETKLIAELRRLGTHRVVYEREGITVLRKQRNLSTSELRIIRATLLVPEDAATS